MGIDDIYNSFMMRGIDIIGVPKINVGKVVEEK